MFVQGKEKFELLASDLADLGIVKSVTPSSINDLTDTGIYYVANYTPDSPASAGGYWVYVVIKAASNRYGQFACKMAASGTNAGEVYYRAYANGWGSWNKLTP